MSERKDSFEDAIAIIIIIFGELEPAAAALVKLSMESMDVYWTKK